MRTIKLIDVLPTLFGALALVGVVLAAYYAPNTSHGQGEILARAMLYGAGALTLITGLVSVISGVVGHKLSKIHYVNIGWIVFPGLYLSWVVLVLFSYSVPWLV